MKYCKECHVKIITPVSKCPLCKTETMHIEGPEVRAYPDLYSAQAQTAAYTAYEPGFISAVKGKQTVPAT